MSWDLFVKIGLGVWLLLLTLRVASTERELGALERKVDGEEGP